MSATKALVLFLGTYLAGIVTPTMWVLQYLQANGWIVWLEAWQGWGFIAGLFVTFLAFLATMGAMMRRRLIIEIDPVNVTFTEGQKREIRIPLIEIKSVFADVDQGGDPVLRVWAGDRSEDIDLRGTRALAVRWVIDQIRTMQAGIEKGPADSEARRAAERLLHRGSE